jgi:hypothetical protein
MIVLSAELQQLAPPRRQNPAEGSAKIIQKLRRQRFSAVFGDEYDM